MGTKIEVPRYKSGSTYEHFKREISAWRLVTELKPEKQGIVVALSLPEDDHLKIKEKVFEEIKVEDLNKDGGLDTLIAFLDKHLGRDDLEVALEKFEDFEDYSRKSDESISQYIANFDQKYSRIRAENITLPPEILAFKLLRRAGISRSEKLLVLTGMNYTEKDGLFDQARKSLRKFVGEGSAGGGKDVLGLDEAIKVEPAFIAETRAAGGWRGGFGAGPRGRLRGGGERPMNPLGRDGQPMTCKCCGSFRHFLRDCPDSWENTRKGKPSNFNKPKEEDAVFFTGCSEQDMTVFISEAYNCAVLDSACSSTVCGEKWLETFLETLSEGERRAVQRHSSSRIFKFGGGTRLHSGGEYVLPVLLAGQRVFVRTDVVESDIPLLLSRETMKRAKVKLDVENDTAEILGKPVSLNVTSCGHYCVPLCEDVTVEQVHAVKLDNLAGKDRKSALLKLHRQFAHPSRGKLEALLRDAGVWRDNFKDDIEDIYQKCFLCKQYASAIPRPVVGLPGASKFNEMVSMDLKLWREGAGTRWILHMIDMYSRYTQSVFISRKRTTDVIDAIMSNWVGVFGVMGGLLTDNGGEFTGEEIRDVMSVLNVRISTTGAESPFQNGLCERVHAVTDRLLVKLRAQYPKTPVDILLKWANMARNSLQMWNGFSSHQLVFGQNPNLPGIMTDDVPALGGKTTSEIFAKHLNALHTARQGYVQLEADERIRRALRNKVRASEQIFTTGDLVFYRREGYDRWLGPGKVVCQDNRIVFVRHGSSLIRVSANRLIKVGEAFKGGEAVDSSSVQSDVRREPAVSEFSCDVGELGRAVEGVSGSDDQMTGGDGGGNDFEGFQDGELAEGSGGRAVEGEAFAEQAEADDPVVLRRSLRNFNKEHGYKVYSASLSKEEQSNWDCLTAKREELEKLRKFDAYEEVKYHGQACISTRWVLTLKNGKPKARLVVRGFEEDSREIVSDSPTVGKTTLRLFLTIVASLGWKVKTTDVKSAFLQGNIMERVVFVKPPREASTGKDVVWKLKKCLYGLSDASRQFYLSVRERMLSVGCLQSKVEPSLFYYFGGGNKLRGILVSHIDDFLHAGEDLFETNVMIPLRERFEVGKLEEESFTYVGFQICQEREGILLDQNEYVREMEKRPFWIKAGGREDRLLDSEEMSQYRGYIGTINWVVQCTRPDMAYELIELSVKSKIASVDDMKRARKLISRIQDFESFVFFPALGEMGNWTMCVYTDASHANLSDGVSSTMGCLVFVVGRGGAMCTVSWRANKIRRVVRSTLAAETMALQEGLEEAIYIRSLLLELGNWKIPIVAYVDNKSLIEALYSTKQVNDRRLRIDIGSLKELLNGEVESIKWIPGSRQLANCLTKRGASGSDLLDVLQSGRMPS